MAIVGCRETVIMVAMVTVTATATVAPVHTGGIDATFAAPTIDKTDDFGKSVTEHFHIPEAPPQHAVEHSNHPGPGNPPNPILPGASSTEIPEEDLVDVTEHNIVMGRTCILHVCTAACKRAGHVAARCHSNTCQCRDRRKFRHVPRHSRQDAEGGGSDGGGDTNTNSNYNVNYNVNALMPVPMAWGGGGIGGAAPYMFGGSGGLMYPGMYPYGGMPQPPPPPPAGIYPMYPGYAGGMYPMNPAGQAIPYYAPIAGSMPLGYGGAVAPAGSSAPAAPTLVAPPVTTTATTQPPSTTTTTTTPLPTPSTTSTQPTVGSGAGAGAGNAHGGLTPSQPLVAPASEQSRLAHGGPLPLPQAAAPAYAVPGAIQLPQLLGSSGPASTPNFLSGSGVNSSSHGMGGPEPNDGDEHGGGGGSGGSERARLPPSAAAMANAVQTSALGMSYMPNGLPLPSFIPAGMQNVPGGFNPAGPGAGSGNPAMAGVGVANIPGMQVGPGVAIGGGAGSSLGGLGAGLPNRNNKPVWIGGVGAGYGRPGWSR